MSNCIEEGTSLPDKIILDSDLIGVSPWLMGQIIFFLMMVLPLGITAIESSYHTDLGINQTAPQLYSVLWILNDLGLFFNAMWFDYEFIMMAFPTIILNIIFILIIIGYYRGMISRNNTIIVGIFSFLIPLGVTMLRDGIFLSGGGYVGPLPFLSIVGLLMLCRVRGPELFRKDSLLDSK